MLLMHVTKNNKCSFCNAGVIKCQEESCQTFFSPANVRHIYCRSRCKMRAFRKRYKQLKE